MTVEDSVTGLIKNTMGQSGDGKACMNKIVKFTRRRRVGTSLYAALIIFLSSFSLTISGHATMTSDDVLKFKTHDLAIRCYGGITNLYLVYAGSSHKLCVDRVASEKTPQDETRYPNFKSGSYHAFAGLVEMEWRSRDGTHLKHTLDLDAIFKDRVVLHKEDPKRIYKPMPITGGEPTIVVEVNDRTVNVYMFVEIQLVPTDPGKRNRDSSDNWTLAYSKML